MKLAVMSCIHGNYEVNSCVGRASRLSARSGRDFSEAVLRDSKFFVRALNRT